MGRSRDRVSSFHRFHSFHAFHYPSGGPPEGLEGFWRDLEGFRRDLEGFGGISEGFGGIVNCVKWIKWVG